MLEAKPAGSRRSKASPHLYPKFLRKWWWESDDAMSNISAKVLDYAMSDNVGSDKNLLRSTPLQLPRMLRSEEVSARFFLHIRSSVWENSYLKICLHHVRSIWYCLDSFICVWILILLPLSWIFALDSPVWICYGKKVEVVVIHQISRLGLLLVLYVVYQCVLSIGKNAQFTCFELKRPVSNVSDQFLNRISDDSRANPLPVFPFIIMLWHLIMS